MMQLSSSAFRGIYENKEEKESIMALIKKRCLRLLFLGSTEKLNNLDF